MVWLITVLFDSKKLRVKIVHGSTYFPIIVNYL